MSGGGKKKDPNALKDQANRGAKGTGGLTFEPPSAAPAEGPDIGFAPDLSPVAAAPSREPDAIDDDALSRPRQPQPRSSNVERRWPAAQRQDMTPAHIEEDADGRLNPVARMLSRMAPRPDYQRSLLDEVQDALREQLGAKPQLHQQQRTFHLPSQMPTSTEDEGSRDQQRSLVAHREEDVVEAEVAEGSSYAGSGDDNGVPVVEPWTPVSDRAGSVEIAPPSDPDGTPIATPQRESGDAPSPVDPDAARPPLSGANAFRDVTLPLTPLPKEEPGGGRARMPASAKDTLLSFPAFGEPDVRLSPPPSASSRTSETFTAPKALTYPIARQAIANLLAGKAPPDRRQGAEKLPQQTPLEVYNPVTRPGKTPWRAKDIVVDDDARDEDPSEPATIALSIPAPAEEASADGGSRPRDGILFDDQTDKNAFELPPRTPAPISLIDGLPVDDDAAPSSADPSPDGQPSQETAAPMSATETGKMPMPNAPRAISMPDMAALDLPVSSDEGATEDDDAAPKTLVNFSIGPAVMRKPADVATPKRPHAFSADASDGANGGSQQGSQRRLETLVDTMLVGQDADTEDGEVHLQFKDDVLRGLYVSLVREGEGLVAKFVVADATVRRQIDGEAQRLVDRLSAKGMNIRGYSIEVRDGGDASERVSAYGDDGFDGF